MRQHLSGELEILGEYVVCDDVKLLLLLALHIYAPATALVACHSGDAGPVDQAAYNLAGLGNCTCFKSKSSRLEQRSVLSKEGVVLQELMGSHCLLDATDQIFQITQLRIFSRHVAHVPGESDSSVRAFSLSKDRGLNLR